MANSSGNVDLYKKIQAGSVKVELEGYTLCGVGSFDPSKCIKKLKNLGKSPETICKCTLLFHIITGIKISSHSSGDADMMNWLKKWGDGNMREAKAAYETNYVPLDSCKFYSLCKYIVTNKREVNEEMLLKIITGLNVGAIVIDNASNAKEVEKLTTEMTALHVDDACRYLPSYQEINNQIDFDRMLEMVAGFMDATQREMMQKNILIPEMNQAIQEDWMNGIWLIRTSLNNTEKERRFSMLMQKLLNITRYTENNGIITPTCLRGFAEFWLRRKQ